MELKQIGRTLSSCYKLFRFENKNVLQESRTSITQIRAYAARKGYREMARKKKVKTVIQKQSWIPHNLRKKDGDDLISVKISLEHTLPQAKDDVWVSRYFAWRIYSFKEAVECHRETYHTTMYNIPDAPVNLFIELDMKTAKPTKFVEKFHRMALLPHIFEQDGLTDRTVMVFCKSPEQKEEAANAGANLVGGVEIIKEIQRGKIVLPDFKFMIAHPDILPEMVTIRGLLKKKFPSIKTGTLGPNIGQLVTQFKNGVEYSCVKNDKLLDYGWIDTCIGRINMDISKLEENFTELLKDINLQRPNRPGTFITRIVMSSPPLLEKLKIDLTPYLEEKEGDGDSSDEEENVSVKI